MQHSGVNFVGEELQKQIVWKNYVTDKIGLPTLEDIKKELAKPGRDPRSAIKVFEFAPNIYKVEDLQIGMVLPGIVTNITKFGVFVDVGVKQDGLVHVSQLRRSLYQRSVGNCENCTSMCMLR